MKTLALKVFTAPIMAACLLAGCAEPVSPEDVLDAVEVCKPWGGVPLSMWRYSDPTTTSELRVRCVNATIIVRNRRAHATQDAPHEQGQDAAPQVLPEKGRRPKLRLEV